MQDFRNLAVWERSMLVAEAVYEVTDSFPRREAYGLGAQLRRSAVSIPSNIAEGAGRGSDADFARFLRISYASACELETQLELSVRVAVAPEPHRIAGVIDSSTEVRKMLGALIRRVQAPKTKS